MSRIRLFIQPAQDLYPSDTIERMNTEYHLNTDVLLPDLQQLKEAGMQQEFRVKLLKALPEVKRYVARSLNDGIRHGHVRKGSCSMEEVVDELYIRAYEHIDEVPDPALFNSWLLLQAEAVLIDKIDEQEFNKLFFTGLERISREEWTEMEEKFSADGDGDLMLLEEFDDQTIQRRPSYPLDQVFILENEKELIENIDAHLSEEEAQQHMQLLLSKIPLSIRNTFDLHFVHGRTIEQIAELRRRTHKEINAELKQVSALIKQSFEGRFWS